MKQRFRSGGKPIKGRRRKTPAKRRNVPNDTPASNVPNSKNDLEFRRLTRELSEARVCKALKPPEPNGPLQTYKSLLRHPGLARAVIEALLRLVSVLDICPVLTQRRPLVRFVGR